MKESGFGWHGALCACRRTEWPFSTILLPFASHMGPGLGEDVGL